jgi:predicted nuclease of predicted toxin-antitoxin system
MRLLLDQNLSPNLMSSLQDLHPRSLHVQDIGMSNVDDSDVWEYARDNELAIVSKDSDFLHLSARYGHPPKVIRLACGDRPTEEIEALLRNYHEEILTFDQNEHEAFLELP